jgi:hypothetical protein
MFGLAKSLKKLFANESCQVCHGNNNIQVGGSINVSSDSNVLIKDGRIIIDGQKLDHYITINIREAEDLEIVYADKIYVNSCRKLSTGQGDITASEVGGNVITSMGDIKVEGDVGGNCETSMGNITIKGICAGKKHTDMGKISN